MFIIISDEGAMLIKHYLSQLSKLFLRSDVTKDINKVKEENYTSTRVDGVREETDANISSSTRTSHILSNMETSIYDIFAALFYYYSPTLREMKRDHCR